MKLADKKNCCGCSACKIACPFGAIRMEQDEELFFYPVVNMEMCKECGKCEKVCPVLNCAKLKIADHNKEVYHGYVIDEKEHRASASGGAATLLSEIILQDGGCIFGSTYYNNYRQAKYIKVTSKKEITAVKGSKYIETEKGDIYNQVNSELKNGKKVLFTGLPCDVAGLKCFLGREYDNLFTCELICHGPTSQKVQQDYVESLEKKHKSKLLKFSSRFNVDGDERPYIRALFENGKEFRKPLWNTEYGYAFAVYSRPSCYNCMFKGDSRVADISVGDSWSVKNGFGDKKGVSIVYIHTEKGLVLSERLKEMEQFQFQKLNYDGIKKDNPAIYESLSEKQERQKFAKYFKRNGLLKASFKSKSFWNKAKYVVKEIKRYGNDKKRSG